MVRISGPRADAALQALTGTLPEPRRATLVTVRGGDGELLDRGVALRFLGPRSATGDDLAELHLHGGRAVVAAVLGALAVIKGLRQAEPGEFTRRAFENGRIDLAEAEGLADLLTAETEAQRRAAIAMAGGALSRQVDQWRERLLGIAAAVEAELDFADEGDVHEGTAPEIAGKIEELAAAMRETLARPPAERLRDGIRIAIAGPPNAGKSSLLNALIQREAAITSEVAGTTRDVIEAPVSIAGIPLLLIDTAGLRDTEDRIESIGVERAEAAVAGADLVLWLGPPRQAPPNSIRISPKSDVHAIDLDADIAVSAATGHGLADLIALVLERSRGMLPQSNEAALNARQRELLRAALAGLDQASAASDPLIRAEHLRRARTMLDRITGRAGVEDMLDALFGRFCIGK
ncbi:MAG TPA: tRNA uridine-5-carboxymethylaminomethyl(34) synthesis GTPase MnmE [Allosphingosinicella sp.]